MWIIDFLLGLKIIRLVALKTAAIRCYTAKEEQRASPVV